MNGIKKLVVNTIVVGVRWGELVVVFISKEEE